MATGSRTLTLKLLADIDNFQKNLKNADNNVSGFEAGIQKFSKVAGAAFLAAGVAAAAYASKLAIDGVKSAIADEAAQLKLAKSLQNVTGATEDQIKATEDYILKTSLAYGVTDEDLRPSLDRLVRSTKDVEEAQKLQTLAINIAAGSGKSLTAVSEALARAHDGNFGSLKRLGVSIDESIIKQKDFDAATKVLASTFRDQASAQADTFDGKLRRLQIAFDEGKETVGSFILDAITPLVDVIVRYVVPAVSAFTEGIGGTKGLKAVFDQYVDFAKRIFLPVFEGLKDAFNNIKNAVMNNKDEFETLFNFLKNYVAPLFGGALKVAIQAIGVALSTVVNILGTFIRLMENAFNAAKRLIDFIKNNPITNFFTGAGYGGGGGGGYVNTNYTGGNGYVVPSDIPTFISPTEAMRERGGFQNNQTNITINGAIDPESTARQLVSLLNDSYYRGTGGADGLVYA